MTFIHFTTELSGGAGEFVRNIHLAMQAQSIPSLVITRDRSNLNNIITIKRPSRLARLFRNKLLHLLNKLNMLDSSYAMFGLERAPVKARAINSALKHYSPKAFIFYWISYFINYKSISELKQLYPDTLIVFICLDEAFIAGGCHYTSGCLGYQNSCQYCPSTQLPLIRKMVSRAFLQRQHFITLINPIVFYPSKRLLEMGGKSNILKGLTSKAIPLGAISLENKKKIGNKRLNYLMNKSQKTSLTLLIRSSREHRKGCDLFLNALKILHDKFPKLRQHLRVISIGDNFINLANIDRFVNHQYKGYVDRKTLMCIYSEVDALLVTSREDAGPIMINESIALGVFVISTPVGVSEDLIVTNHNGIVTEDISAEAISEALFLLLQMYAEETWKQHAVQLVKKDKMQLTFEGYIESLVTLI